MLASSGSLFPSSCLFPLFLKELTCTLCLHKPLPINKAQLLSYMKLLEIPWELIINFNELKLTDGLSRLILPGANLE